MADERDIYVYYRQKEVEQQLSPNYLENQTEVTPDMRQRVGEWMYKLSDTFTPDPEIFFVAIAILDHFLARFTIMAEDLSVVATACVGLAIKFVSDFDDDDPLGSLASETHHSKASIIEVEWTVLQTLDHQLGFITPYSYLDYFDPEATFRYRNGSEYLAEFAITVPSIVSRFPPSMIAASAIYLIRMLGGIKPIWTEAFQERTEYTEQDLRLCIMALIAVLRVEAKRDPPSDISIRFMSPHLSRVSQAILDFYKKY